MPTQMTTPMNFLRVYTKLCFMQYIKDKFCWTTDTKLVGYCWYTFWDGDCATSSITVINHLIMHSYPLNSHNPEEMETQATWLLHPVWSSGNLRHMIWCKHCTRAQNGDCVSFQKPDKLSHFNALTSILQDHFWRGNYWTIWRKKRGTQIAQYHTNWKKNCTLQTPTQFITGSSNHHWYKDSSKWPNNDTGLKLLF